MPLYEYRCSDCGRVFEVFTQRVAPRARPACPNCGETKVERVWSPFATQSRGPSCAAPSAGAG